MGRWSDWIQIRNAFDPEPFGAVITYGWSLKEGAPMTLTRQEIPLTPPSPAQPDPTPLPPEPPIDDEPSFDLDAELTSEDHQHIEDLIARYGEAPDVDED